MTLWYRLLDSGRSETHFIPHWMPDELSEIVQEDLIARGLRGYTLIESKLVLEGHALYLDMPGMVMQDREYVFVTVDDLRVQIPCIDVGVFYEDLRAARVRPGEYIKLHGFLKCLCLTLPQRDAMIEQLGDKLSYAEAIAHTENQRFNEAFADLPEAVVVGNDNDLSKEVAKAQSEGRTIRLAVKRRETKKNVPEA